MTHEPLGSSFTPRWIQKMALSRLGQSLHEIASQYGHRDVNADTATTNYLSSLRFVIMDLWWIFPPRQEALTFYADNVGGAVYPPDCLQILAVGCCVDCCGVLHGDEFEVREIVTASACDSKNVSCRIFPCCCGTMIRYVASNECFDHWNPIAIEMLVLKLASMCAAQITGDRSNLFSMRFEQAYQEQRRTLVKSQKRKYIR